MIYAYHDIPHELPFKNQWKYASFNLCTSMETVHVPATDLTLHIKNYTRLQKVIYFIVRNKLQMLQDLTCDLQCDTQNIMQKAPNLIDNMNEQ